MEEDEGEEGPGDGSAEAATAVNPERSFICLVIGGKESKLCVYMCAYVDDEKERDHARD